MQFESLFTLAKALLALMGLLACAAVAQEAVPSSSREPSPRIRPPKDLVGYTHTAEGIEKVISQAMEAERLHPEGEPGAPPAEGGPTFTGAICPHDDYAYAARVYLPCFYSLRARHVLLIGVAHHARSRPECEGKLVFDDFDTWQGPYGDVPISPLREAWKARLDAADYLVDDDLHREEHSLEGLVPFLQHFDREAAIVPVLVPYMSRQRILDLALKAAKALAPLLEERGLRLGRDVAVLISSDCVHYGDWDWGGKSFADFGTDGKAYDQAVARDRSLIADFLTGSVSLEGLCKFYDRTVAEDFHEYRITWCGRFSIPFGLALLYQLSARQDLDPPRGQLLQYGTTLDPGRSDPGVQGLGVTAPANLHHWVGFAAIGYR